MKNSSEIPIELEKEFRRTHELVYGFIHWLNFCILDTARDSNFQNNHLLSFLNQDILETLTGVLIHVKEGIHTPVIRESRYLLELSIKLAYIQQQNYSMPIDEKLEVFHQIIKSTNISPMKRIEFKYFKLDTAKDFLIETNRLYGNLSRFVHLTHESIQYRRNRLDNERLIGMESEEDLIKLNDLLQRVYAVCIVFISHSIPQYVLGDWHIDSSGELTNWCYIKSKYVAEIDETLDYKHERQHILEKVRLERAACIAF